MQAANPVLAKIITREELTSLRTRHSAKTIVFCGGCFDLFHAGHAVFLSQCKALGDLLVAGVGRDVTIRRLKGFARPINPENNRLFVVASVAAVDYALLTDDSTEHSDIHQLLRLLRPDVLALTEQDTTAIAAERDLCTELGTRMTVLPRIAPDCIQLLSTSAILRKIHAEKRGGHHAI